MRTLILLYKAIVMSRNPQPDKTDTDRQSGERIAKAIARAGICSRREAERFIAAGRVALNGHILASPAINVEPDDRVTIDGKHLKAPEPARLWRYHKPAGLVTTHRDPQGRATVFGPVMRCLPVIYRLILCAAPASLRYYAVRFWGRDWGFYGSMRRRP